MKTGTVQKFVIQTSTNELLKAYLQLAMATVLDTWDEIVIKIIDKGSRDHCLPAAVTYEGELLPIILITGWFKPKEEWENSYFEGCRPWKIFHEKKDALKYIESLLLSNWQKWEKEFNQKFSNSPTDKESGLGYELRACGTHPEIIALSIVPMVRK